jgi:multidrug resistance efflux pump
VAVKTGVLTQSLIVTGELVAVRATRVAVPRFRERGAVPIQAMAPEGSEVSPGDVLLQIDNSNLTASLNTEIINLDKAENDLARKQAEEEARLKELEVERASRRLEMERAALKAEIPKEFMRLRDWQDNQFDDWKARKEHERAASGLTLARKAGAEDVTRLRRNRDQIRARIMAIRDDLEALQIRATSHGTVLYEHAPLTWNSGENPRKFQVGDQVYPGNVVMSVPDLSEMEVRVAISEVDGALVRPGMAARVTPDALPDQTFPGTLASVREVAERPRRLSNVRVFTGTVSLARTDPRIMKPGMSVKVEIVRDEHRGLLVPRNALVAEGGRFSVRHAARGATEVKVVARNAVAALVEGLAEGDQIELAR